MPAIRSTLTAVILLTASIRLAAQDAQGPETRIPMTPDRWTTIHDTAPGAAEEDPQFEKRFGRPSLLLPDGFAYANGVDFKNGTLDADVAVYPNSAFFGVAFHVQSPDKYELVFFRPGSTTETVQYTPSFMNMNEWRLFSGPEYTASPPIPQDQWVHVRIVVKGLVASVYLDRDPAPVIEVHDLTLGSVGGAV